MVEPLERKQFMLTKEQTDNLKIVGEDMIFLESELMRMERAGIDVADLRKQFDAAKKLQKGLVQEFGV